MVKYMLQRPILSRKRGKWAYVLVEYDLLYEPLRAMKGQIIADFIVDNAVVVDDETYLVEMLLWKLFFDGLVCNREQAFACVIISLSGANFDLSIRLEFACTNNQAEYEALLYGLEYFRDMGVRNVDTFGDSRLVVKRVNGESQCLHGVLNIFHVKCLDIVRFLYTFHINHIRREENKRADVLAQQASSYKVRKGIFFIKRKSTSRDTFICNSESARSGLPYDDMELRKKPTLPHSEDGESAAKESMVGNMKVSQ
jgi:ribonuclease HI